MKQLLFAIALVLLTACGGHRSPQSWAERLSTGQPVDSVAFRYARLIHIEQADGYRVVYIDNPWKPGLSLHRYVLVPYAATMLQQRATDLPSGTVVRVPLRRSVIFTSVHCALAEQLGATEQVSGVADLKYIKVPFVQEGVKSGRLTDCGDGMSPLVEKIIDTEADGILLSPFENSGGYGRLEEVDIPIIECAEYMEASPLARAEWMRFYGMLYGQEERADSLFSEVESHYRAMQQVAQTAQQKPSVVLDKMAGSVWYVPGGRSTIGQMLNDAQCSYPWADDQSSGSLQLPYETVLERAGQCQLWLLRYDAPSPLTMQSLLSEKDGYRMLEAVRNGEVYGCNVSTSMFYEETPFRPDLLLQDFITILHPDIPNQPDLRYYHKVQ
ncbi:MAG: ABC transporter substrate-binding protein [Prevotella sp.]|nr:ABC transporter substrate-binding protein [Prevotella sp.]